MPSLRSTTWRVGCVELDVQVGQHRVPEPGDVGTGAGVQFIVGGDAVAIHEGLQIAGRDPLGVGLPDNLLAEGEGGFGR